MDGFFLGAELRDRDVDRRLDRMIEIADERCVTLDTVVEAIGWADHRIFDAVSDNPSLLPLYTKSNVKP